MTWYVLAQSNFLETSESAYQWASENVDLKYSEESLETEFMNDSDKQYVEKVIAYDKERAEVYSDKYLDVMTQNQVTIYRAIMVPVLDEGDLLASDIKAINWGNVGTHWSFELEGAGSYGYMGDDSIIGHGAPRDIIITCHVDPRYIDWEYGFTSFMYYGKDQWECALLKGSPIHVFQIEFKSVDIKARA